jgi:hypothetical protein
MAGVIHGLDMQKPEVTYSSDEGIRYTLCLCKGICKSESEIAS